MRTVTAALIAVLAGTIGAWAAEDPACSVASSLIGVDFSLPRVAEAIKNKKLSIVVVGSGSSTFSDAANVPRAYPTRLQVALSSRLPGVVVTVTTYIRPRKTAEDVEKELSQIVDADKPALVVWQTGTVDMMQRISPDDFSSALEEGIDAVETGKSDLLLMNMQYSPLTESMMLVPPYAEAMRIAALQHEVLLFDRLAVMRHWSEMGTFDLNEATKKIDMAAHVHDCIGVLLANLVVDAANASQSNDRVVR